MGATDDLDRYRSLETGAEVELKIKASRFRGRAYRVQTGEEAERQLAQVRKKDYDATHHCWGYRIGSPEETVERADDDGEPTGTAGPPILSVLQGALIHDALVIVTRWFGGTKLGKGGLIRAYSDATRTALDAAPERTVWREVTCAVACEYVDVGALEAVIAREGERIRGCERDFSGRPQFTVTVLRSQADRLRELIREATAGRAEFLR